MLLIAHRGNLHGPVAYENEPSYIEKTLNKGYHAEVDVWYKNNKIFFGHDLPTYLVEQAYLFRHQQKLWLHAKNLEALKWMLERNLHCFWHQNDDFTITSRGLIWTYPNKPHTSRSVIVSHGSPQKLVDSWGSNEPYGLCNDYVGVLCGAGNVR